MHAKRLVCYFQGQGQNKGSYDQIRTVSALSAELIILLSQNLVWYYTIISQNVLWKNGIVMLKVKVIANFKLLINVCPDILWMAEPLTTKLGMVTHHYDPDGLPKRLVCCLQDQDHREGSYNQNVFWTADLFATQLDLIAHYHKLDCLVKRLDRSVVVKVTEKVKNSSDCSSGQYLLKCWTFCNQTWYGDASSWVRVSCKKIGLLSSSSRS